MSMHTFLQDGRSITLFKAGDKTSVKNYRSISLLSSISKVLERLVFNKIVTHLVSRLSPHQFDFIKEPPPYNSFNIPWLLNKQPNTNQYHIHVPGKAFDTISYGTLFNHLWSFGITGTRFKCYLTDRLQQISINNTLSDSTAISGIPQGPPIISCLYDLFQCRSQQSLEVCWWYEVLYDYFMQRGFYNRT